MKKISSIISILLCITFLVISFLVITNNITSFDDFIYQKIFSQRNNTLDFIWKNITKLGNTIPILCITIILLLFLKQEFQKILGIEVVEIIIVNQTLKRIIHRPRPNHLRLIKQGGFSYPSGHAMISVAIYGFLIYFVLKTVKNKYLKWLLIAGLTTLIIGIGISRIYVGVHYPSDILGGYALSLFLLINSIQIENKYFGGNHE